MPSCRTMRRASGRMPHPRGMIEVRLERTGAAGVTGEITLPPGVRGQFRWRNQAMALVPGRNAITR